MKGFGSMFMDAFRAFTIGAGLIHALAMSAQDCHARVERDGVPVQNRTRKVWDAGWLVVPERHGSPERTIRLPFVRVMADSSGPARTAILVMSGGPGNSSLHMANGTGDFLARKDLDVVVLEQRGTYHAEPDLLCPEEAEARISAVRRGLGPLAIDSAQRAGLRACRGRLERSGVDLSAYGSLEAIADIECLRQQLGIHRFILYGMSYSAVLMSGYASSHPDHVKAVILDSPMLHEMAYDIEAYAHFDQLARTVLESQASPSLVDSLQRYLVSLGDSVLWIRSPDGPFHYSTNQLVDLIFGWISDDGLRASTASLARRLIRGEHADVLELRSGMLEAGHRAYGLRLSVWCAEELPEEDPRAIRQARERFPWLRYYPVNDVDHEHARLWGVAPDPRLGNWPRRVLHVPALLTFGEFDPFIPPSYAPVALKNFPEARVAVIPGTSHVPTFRTAAGEQVLLDFINSL